MSSALRALVWEQVWKNRIVFPMLVLLVGVGAGLTEALVQADSGVWWGRAARQGLFVAFAATVLLSFVPFTLMETQAGWRMNSMVTRWFVLPVRTVLLVLVPYAAACLCVGLFVGLWMLLFRRLMPDLEWGHVLRVLVLGVAVTQTLAWILPRKPGQFWPALALWFPAMLMLAVLPLDGDGWRGEREWVRMVMPVALPLLGLVAWTAARLNRCGVWSGELPFTGAAWGWIWRRLPTPEVRGPRMALLGSDVAPVLRRFGVMWVGVVVLVLGVQCLLFLRHPGRDGFPPGTLMHVAAVVLPALGLLWLPVGGLFLGNEPGMGFRTSLTSYRATRPVGAGTLAAQRLWVAMGMWILVWLSWVILVVVHLQWHPQWAGVDLPGVRGSAPRLMALSAHAMIGALPVLLWGRLEGFPNVLLASMAAWAGTWWLAGMVNPEADMAIVRLTCLVGLTVKGVVSAAAFYLAWRGGHCSGRFIAGVVMGWLVIVGVVGWGWWVWGQGESWVVARVALLIPLARLAMCPLAVAANRHR